MCLPQQQVSKIYLQLYVNFLNPSFAVELPDMEEVIMSDELALGQVKLCSRKVYVKCFNLQQEFHVRDLEDGHY